MSVLQLPADARNRKNLPLSNKPSAIAMRKRRAEYRAQGLNAEGKPYVKQQHPELHGLKDHNWYVKLWNLKRERQAVAA